MQVGVILFDFAPDFEFAGLTVRWETLALAVTIVVVIGLAALIAGRVSVVSSGPSAVSGGAGRSRPGHSVLDRRATMPGFADTGSYASSSTAPAGETVGDGREFTSGSSHLSRVDLIVIALSALPGAIVGGRIGYAIVHLDYYTAHPAAIVDPGQGSLELGVATVGGTMTALIVAGALRAPIGRWLHAAAFPVLLGLALGKLAMALSADGQGLPSDAAWATAYLGAGPWGSLAPQVPSHPAQLYEGGLTLLATLVLLGMFAARLFKARDGRAFVAAIGLWAVVRTGAASVWRDPAILGPLRAGQLIALAIAVVSLLLWLAPRFKVARAVEKADA